MNGSHDEVKYERNGKKKKKMNSVKMYYNFGFSEKQVVSKEVACPKTGRFIGFTLYIYFLFWRLI